MSQPSPHVRGEIRGSASILTIDRPDRRNALSRAIINTLADQIDVARYAPSVRSIIITGNGRTFSAGMDLKDASVLSDDADTAIERAAVADAQALSDLLTQIHSCPKPVIVALNGDAFGGGAGLAMACDLVVADDSARIGYPEVRRGLVGAIVIGDLLRIVGDRRARALLLTGEPINAAEAERWGMVNRVVEPGRCLDEALALAGSLAGCGPIALATTKRQLDEAGRRPHDLRGPAAISAAIRVSDEATEGIAAFLGRRLPTWAAPPSDGD